MVLTDINSEINFDTKPKIKTKTKIMIKIKTTTKQKKNINKNLVRMSASRAGHGIT